MNTVGKVSGPRGTGKLKRIYMSKKPVEITREQLDALRTKFDLLQGDRKAYFETYETTKRSNEAQLKDLRDANKDFRRQLAELQRAGRDAAVGDVPGSATGSTAALGGSSSSTTKLEGVLKAKQMQYNTLRAKTAEKQKELNALQDHLRDLGLESKKPAEEDSPTTRKIRDLETRLDKAMIKYNETQSIKKTYEQIVARLKEERVGFDNQLAALERTLAAKEHDHAELMLLATDAQHAKEVAMGELDRVRALARQEQDKRTKALKEKQLLAKARSERDALARERDRLKAEAMQELTGNAGEELRTSLEEAEMEAARVKEEASIVMKKLDVYDEAFKQIKEATGVSDVNEVIQKVMAQEQQQTSLKALTKDNQDRIESLNAEISSLKERVEDLRYSGSGFAAGSRKSIDVYEEKLAAATQRLERAKEKYDRVAKILIGVKAGIDHLTDKLSSVRRGEAAAVLGVLDAPPPPSTSIAEANDETIVDVLGKCEATIVEIVNRMELYSANAASDALEASAEELSASPRPPSVLAATGSLSMSGSGFLPGTTGSSGMTLAALGISEKDVEATRIYNMRIPMNEDAAGGKDDSDDDGGRFGVDDDACETRESVKRTAKAALNQNRRNTGKKKEP